VSNCVIRWPAARRRSLRVRRSRMRGRRHRGNRAGARSRRRRIHGSGQRQQPGHDRDSNPLFIRLATQGFGHPEERRHQRHHRDDETMLHSSITGVPGSYVENVIVKDLIFNFQGDWNPGRGQRGRPRKAGLLSAGERRLWLQRARLRDVCPARPQSGAGELRVQPPRARCPARRGPRRLPRYPAAKLCRGRPDRRSTLLRVRQSTNVTVSGYQSVAPLPSFLVVEGDRTSDIKLTGNDFSGCARS